MIIKLTVRDNDFQKLIEHFVSDWHFYHFNIPTVDEALGCIENTEELLENVRLSFDADKFRDLINPNYKLCISEEDEKFIIDYIKRRFNKFLEAMDMEAKTKEYLIDAFDVDILSCFYDADENGESFYYLQRSGTLINQ